MVCHLLDLTAAGMRLRGFIVPALFKPEPQSTLVRGPDNNVLGQLERAKGNAQNTRNTQISDMRHKLIFRTRV